MVWTMSSIFFIVQIGINICRSSNLNTFTKQPKSIIWRQFVKIYRSVAHMWLRNEWWKRDVITSIYCQLTRHAWRYMYADYILETGKRKHSANLWPHLRNGKHKFQFGTCIQAVSGISVADVRNVHHWRSKVKNCIGIPLYRSRIKVKSPMQTEFS